MKFEPLGSRIAIREEEAENKTKSGIIIPESSKEKPSLGEVVCINGETKEEFNIDVGTKVAFAKYSGTPLEIDEETLLILDVDDLFGIIRD